MNRFFSKLDLRDIKIDPTGSRFPPDGETVDRYEEVEDRSPAAVDAPESPLAERQEDVAPPATDEEERDRSAEMDEPAPVDQAESHLNGDARYADARADAVAGETVERAPSEFNDVLKVSAKSRPSAVAGAIAGVVRELGRAEVQAIGAGATNQAVKAAAIARDYLLETGIDAVCLPAFIDVIIDNEERTAMRLVIEPR